MMKFCGLPPLRPKNAQGWGTLLVKDGARRLVGLVEDQLAYGLRFIIRLEPGAPFCGLCAMKGSHANRRDYAADGRVDL